MTPHIRRLLPSDLAAVVAHLNRTFVPHEPLNAALNLQVDEVTFSFDEMLHECLVDEGTALSYAMVDGEDTIVAIMLAYMYERKKVEEANATIESQMGSKFGEMNPKMQHIYGIIDSVEKYRHHSLPAHCTKLLAWEIISVSLEQQRRGMAQTLARHVEMQARARGCHGVMTTLTNVASQTLCFEKLSYSPIHTLHHKFYLDANGNRVFNYDGKTDKLVVAFKMFD